MTTRVPAFQIAGSADDTDAMMAAFHAIAHWVDAGFARSSGPATDAAIEALTDGCGRLQVLVDMLPGPPCLRVLFTPDDGKPREVFACAPGAAVMRPQ